MMTTTRPVAVISAARSLIVERARAASAANGAENAASPTMPLSTPIEVMPICTTERNLVGLSCRSIACLRARIAGLHHHLQPGLAARGERHLGHGEQRVQEDQEEQEGNVHARARRVGGQPA